MNLRKTFSLTISIFLVFLSACTPPYIYESLWQSKPVVIDGQTNDWEVPLRFFDTKTKLNYSITNDADNIYICVRATDDDNVKGITRRGLQLWIDTTGKKKHQVGILFPFIQKQEQSESGKHRSEGSDGLSEQTATSDPTMIDTAKQNRMHRRFMEEAKQMRVTGFRTIPNGLVELPDIYGLNLAVSWNSYNVLVYEASIPIKTFLNNPLADSTKVLGISFNFTVNPKRTSAEGSGSHGGGGHGGGMGGGMGGGGMHGGGGGHGGGNSSSEPEPESVWAAFRLSTGK